MVEMAPQTSIKADLLAILREKRIVGICLFIALCQFQYGFDSAAVSGFQSMPGFLAVFGYVDVSNHFPFVPRLLCRPALDRR